MPILAPLELLLVVALIAGAFWLFRKALNSKKLDKVIDEVAHPEVHTLDGAAEGLDRARATAAATLTEVDAEIEKKRSKTNKLREAYGGGSNL